MGIPSYFLHIVNNHRNIIKKIYKNNIDNFYLDCNSIIYDAYYNLDKKLYKIEDIENMIMKNVCNKIVNYIEIISPTKKIYIAFDGVAPVAKLAQQRNRRYKNEFQKEYLKSKTNLVNWNTTSITPGTVFMKKLSLYVETFFKKYSLNYSNKNIIISTSDINGEGEHKIFEYIRSLPIYHSNTTTVIYGMDADLFMLSLNHIYISKQLYLYRETPEFIKNIDITLNPNESYLIDITELSNKIIHYFTDKPFVEIDNFSDDVKRNYLCDYIFICFLLGNDFLPHFPAINIRINGIEILMNTYKSLNNNKHNFFLTKIKNNINNKNINNKNNKKNNKNKNIEINWKNVRELIKELSINENKLMCNQDKVRNKISKRIPLKFKNIEDYFISLPLINRTKEKYINPYEEYWEERYYKILFNIDYDESRIKKICINYLEGLEWTLNYYCNKCIDYNWKYMYNYPPLLSDLSKYVPYFDTKLIKDNNNKPLNSMTQLAYVIPYNSLNLLPDKLCKYLKQNYEHFYNSEFDIEWSYCRYFWESHMHLYDINIDELENIIHLIQN
jgi:5'-3' exonuclease